MSAVPRPEGMAAPASRSGEHGPAQGAGAPALSDREFELFRALIYEVAGIHLTPAKKALVSGRLAKRLKHFGLGSYREYFDLLHGDGRGELQTAVDLLTTNETYFFREPRHFDFLRERVFPSWGREPRRFWSAASASGEEAYTLAMLAAEHAPSSRWEVVGTDISTRVLEQARCAKFPMQRAQNIPRAYLTKYCLRGIGRQDGMLLIVPDLRARVRFEHLNLKSDASHLGRFDVILLRNVLIYFDLETKREVLSRVLCQLAPGGYLLVGHAETLNGIQGELQTVVPSVYRRP